MTDKAKLAKKQKRVLDLLTKGKSPTQVAKTLKISVNGVYGHMRRIEAKGYTVPRQPGSTRTKTQPPKKQRKAATNGSVSAIDGEIAKLAKSIQARQKEIAKETLKIKGEANRLNTQVEDLLVELDALAQRQVALAAAGA